MRFLYLSGVTCAMLPFETPGVAGQGTGLWAGMGGSSPQHFSSPYIDGNERYGHGYYLEPRYDDRLGDSNRLPARRRREVGSDTLPEMVRPAATRRIPDASAESRARQSKKMAELVNYLMEKFFALARGSSRVTKEKERRLSGYLAEKLGDPDLVMMKATLEADDLCDALPETLVQEKREYTDSELTDLGLLHDQISARIDAIWRMLGEAKRWLGPDTRQDCDDVRTEMAQATTPERKAVLGTYNVHLFVCESQKKLDLAKAMKRIVEREKAKGGSGTATNAGLYIRYLRVISAGLLASESLDGLAFRLGRLTLADPRSDDD